jgi:hypothetical protein
MSERETNISTYKDLPDGKCLYLVPPTIICMMTGVSCAQQSKDGCITLTYSDGHTESATIDIDLAARPNFFNVVSALQSKLRSQTAKESRHNEI